jgi:hypothetical protein
MSAEDPWTSDSLRDCPACGLPTEVVERFTVDSSTRPVEHLKLVCVAGHWVTAPVDSLSVANRQRGEQAGPHPLTLADVSQVVVTTSTQSRVRRTVRRLKQVWEELDHAQRRMFDIQTGGPLTER